MATKWQEKNVGVIRGYKPGAKKATPVINEETGELGGKHVEHYDGSVDAVITPPTVGARTNIQEGSEDR